MNADVANMEVTETTLQVSPQSVHPALIEALRDDWRREGHTKADAAGRGWYCFPLFDEGRPVANLDAWYNSKAFLESIGRNRLWKASWSVLGPRSHLEPHRDRAATRTHFPLVVPTGNVGFRSGGDETQLRCGVPYSFDASEEHFAWNLTEHYRAVLVVERTERIGLAMPHAQLH